MADNFEVGKTYQCTCHTEDHHVYEYKVIKRTKKTVTLLESGKSKQIIRKIHDTVDTGEYVNPDGNHAMSLTLWARYDEQKEK